jgi:hypothetical protein
MDLPFDKLRAYILIGRKPSALNQKFNEMPFTAQKKADDSLKNRPHTQ